MPDQVLPSRGLSRRSFMRSAALVGALGAVQARTALARGAGEPFSLVRVRADGRIDELSAGFDLTEHGAGGWYDVVAHPGDHARLRAAGFTTETVVEDLLEMELRDRRAELAAQSGSSERLTYRVLADYEADLAGLAAAAPGLVRHFTLPFTTHEGRTVHGVEIAGGVASAATDGRPASMIMGLHHAREWPSAELSMMFAEDLVAEYLAGTPAIVSLLDAVRVFVVPVVNPDGFVRSRETISDWAAPLPGGAAVLSEYAYHRKNMRSHGGFLGLEFGRGVDPNRNYPYKWGGAGASREPSSQTHYGRGPGSEPEVANILSLLRTTPVVTMITNHTYSNLILRPWGDTHLPTPDDAAMHALGEQMRAFNGYQNIKGVELYATTGTTDEWHYGTCGAFAYTFEIGGRGTVGFGNTTPVEGAGFHPQYNLWIQRFYDLNRGAFLRLVEAARETQHHVVLTGLAPAGSELRLFKSVQIPSGRFGWDTMTEEISGTMIASPAGTFTWHVNPSVLPKTESDVRAGTKPASAREPYTVTARHPKGLVREQTVVAMRGETYTLDLR